MASEASVYGQWPVDSAMRAKLVERISLNLASMAFFNDKAEQIGSEAAGKRAVAIEAEAFETASRAPGGGQEGDSGSARVRAYAKHASQLMLGALKLTGGPAAGAAAAPATSAAAAAAPAEGVVEGLKFDVSGGSREFLTKETAQQLLEPLLDPASSRRYTEVCLSSKSFGRDASEVAAQALATCAGTLKHADLSDIIAGRPEEEALASLARICAPLEGVQLETLNLSDNALGEKGVRACAAAIRGQKSLRSLAFCNNGVSVEAARAIAELLPSARELRTLHFFNNMSGDGGAVALAKLVREALHLADFRFSSTRVGTDGGIALAEAILSGTRSLRKLDLRDNMFGEEGGRALARALAQQPLLQELYLSDTGLGDGGVAAIAEALEGSAPDLQVLELGCNEVTPVGAAALARCLAKKPALRRVGLGENELLDKGALLIARAFSDAHASLEELDLNMNDFGRVGAVAAAQAVAGKASFKLLNVNGNHISEEGIDAVKAILAKGGTAGEGALGPLDENDEDGDGEGEEEEEEGEGGEGEEREGEEEGAGDSVVSRLGTLELRD